MLWQIIIKAIYCDFEIFFHSQLKPQPPVPSIDVQRREMGAGTYRPKPPPLSWHAKWIWVVAVVAIVAIVALATWLIVTKSPSTPIPP